ncbi:MAG: RluA family pseudouridine synthase [Candidatus Shikimatogenerans bostrichidophilus]|nr:MAG: RluA family pseudouridine synthase [Candidatus Shikimatogenerans bostrichidophilus]
MHKYIYIKNTINKRIRIDKYLFIYFKKKISRQKIQLYILKKLILLNNKTIKKKYLLKNNDVISYINKIIKLDDHNYIYSNKNLNVDIHYEDDNILIINKKPGQVVHPGHGNYKNTLVNWLKYYYNKPNISENNEYNNRFGLLHRLDKDTSGLLMVAKNIFTFNYIKDQFVNRTLKKTYLAIIWGTNLKNKNIIKNYIARNKKNRIKMIVVDKKYNGKLSITKYKILKKFKFFSLIKCKLETGRTHQIRVHFKHIGHPILNDKLYGGDKLLVKNKNYNKKIIKLLKILPRQALHASTLIYKDPITKNYKKILTKIPNDIKRAIKYLKYNF